MTTLPPRSAAAVLLVLAACAVQGSPPLETARWQARAAAVTITRDEWGIPHIRGATDADAVFGMIYAQAEDDFPRIEANYLDAMGRRAEVEGEKAIWRDLRMKLFVDPAAMQARYAESPSWLRALMDAWADGLNYYLHTHPAVAPRLLTRFEPWMALAFTEGSIGGDIAEISLTQLAAFYGKQASGTAALPPAVDAPRPLGGSNGFAIAPSRTAGGKALLLINPHTSFFFREELQMTSGEGLDAYGAVTWGQFFVYQGFNARVGWMHTTSGADVIDEYAETVTAHDGGFRYRHGGEERPVQARRITIPFRSGGGMASREFTVYRTHHGPVVREADGKWIAVRLMEEPVKALTQSYLRTKATSHAAFLETMRLHTNSSNNTVFADADGNIAYFHANHVPRRDPRFDWSHPVDGSDPATGWQGLHTVEESPYVLNPATGWIQNTNNWPYSAAGNASPRASAFAGYFDTVGENARGEHAIEVLSRRHDFTLATLAEAAYDPHLIAFDALVASLVADYDGLPAGDARRAALAEPVATLRAWDRRSGVASVATSLAVTWGDELARVLRADPAKENRAVAEGKQAGDARLTALAAATERLTRDFGTWRTPWGEINRFQRLSGDIEPRFADAAPSTAVGFPSARWGSLAAFEARTYPGTKRRYGTSGNSFVAVVEFGDKVRALAVTAGGLDSVPGSRHFDDQAERYARGDLREVWFHPEQLALHTERSYHPGLDCFPGG